jgi:Fe2+ transport system protein FeoA
MTLAELPIGNQAQITGFLKHTPSLTRLRELGIVPGTPITIIRHAPLGDPIEIRVRSSHLAMRLSDATHILVSDDGSQP